MRSGLARGEQGDGTRAVTGRQVAGWAGGSHTREEPGKGLGEQPCEMGTGRLLQEQACGTVRTSLRDRQAGQRKAQRSNRDATPRAREACQPQSEASTSRKNVLFPPGTVG